MFQVCRSRVNGLRKSPAQVEPAVPDDREDTGLPADELMRAATEKLRSLPWRPPPPDEQTGEQASETASDEVSRD